MMLEEHLKKIAERVVITQAWANHGPKKYERQKSQAQVSAIFYVLTVVQGWTLTKYEMDLAKAMEEAGPEPEWTGSIKAHSDWVLDVAERLFKIWRDDQRVD